MHHCGAHTVDAIDVTGLTDHLRQQLAPNLLTRLIQGHFACQGLPVEQLGDLKVIVGHGFEMVFDGRCGCGFHQVDNGVGGLLKVGLDIRANRLAGQMNRSETTGDEHRHQQPDIDEKEFAADFHTAIGGKSQHRFNSSHADRPVKRRSGILAAGHPKRARRHR